MDKFIKEHPKLIDIQSKQARDNLTLMVDYLCSSIVPDKLPPLNKLGNESMLECHMYLIEFLYTKENALWASEILQKRTKIFDYDYIDGFSSIYDLNRDYLIDLYSKRFFESVAALEHELIHILPALKNNNPEEQYNEILSIFGEFLSLELLSEKYNNKDIYVNNLINRCIKRMSYRVYGRDFEDETIEGISDFLQKHCLSFYDYMLGFIYAIRLLDLYHQDHNKIITDFNLVLEGKKTVKALLTKYNISLEDKETMDSFIKFVDSYREWVDIKYGSFVHRVK